MAPTTSERVGRGPEELALMRAADMCAFPPVLPKQATFHPVRTEDYAVRIARLERARERRTFLDRD